MKPALTKPPLGITPKKIHDLNRGKELIAALSRYSLSGKTAPSEWFDELSDILIQVYFGTV